MKAMNRIVSILLFSACVVPSGSAVREQTSSQKATQEHPTSKAKAQVHKFGFFVQSVDPEQETVRYRLEGVTVDGWRIALSCPNYPPVEVERKAFRKHSGEELAQKYEEYKDIERFRELVLRSAVATIEEPRTPSQFGRMTIYHATLVLPDTPEQEKQAAMKDPFGVVVAHCWLVNEVENGEDIFSVTVLSSEFRNWKDGKGYEVDARTADESLTLGCTEEKGAACQSLPLSSYRATRSGSMVRLYDKDLNLVGSYRVLSEKPAK